MAGYFKNDLEPEDRKELADLIEECRQGICPPIVPLTLIGHYARTLRKDYVRRQTLLEP